jgi:FtsP/CotA-like multicopper oxidase with cupredoxin domain
MMMGSQLMFTINGDMFAPGMVAPNEVATCNTLEVITMTNSTGLSIIPHPMHFHGRQFQILDRSVGASGLTNWNTVKDGLIDAGWKDTFLIMPQETVRLLVRHSSYPGMYVYHCHNLHHEDMDMMRNFRLDP